MLRKDEEMMLGNLMESKMVDLEKRKSLIMSDDFYELSNEEQVVFVNENRKLKEEIDSLKKRINELALAHNKVKAENRELVDELARVTHDGSLWLGDVLEIEDPKFGSNNLIVSPVGSGKTYAITEMLAPRGSDIQLLLVSTTHLKNSIAPDIAGDEKRKQDGINVFTTRNRNSYGDKDVKIWVMTYAEFGSRIEVNDDFVKENNITDIYCDEIHSLIEYKWFAKTEPLINAMRYLLQYTEGVNKYYFTATTEYLERLKKENSEWFAEMSIFDYSNYPDIKKYTAMNEVNYSHLEQLRDVLRNHSGDFKAYGKKGLFFSSRIATLENMADILIEEGFKPLVLWSTNNEANHMNEEQLNALNELIETEEIPKDYDFLLINGAMREGWNLNDKNVELVIINSTSETDIIQARGRVRKNISSLYIRNDEGLVDQDIIVPEDYLGKHLDTQSRNDLITMLNIINRRGKLSGWNIVKGVLEGNGYTIEETRKSIDGKRIRVTIINKSSDINNVPTK